MKENASKEINRIRDELSQIDTVVRHAQRDWIEFVRKGGVLSVRTLGEEKVEAIELEVPSDSVYINRPLRRLDLPGGSLIGAIARPDGEVLIPDDTMSIQAGDRIIVFSLEGAVRKLETKFLANK